MGGRHHLEILKTHINPGPCHLLDGITRSEAKKSSLGGSEMSPWPGGMTSCMTFYTTIPQGAPQKHKPPGGAMGSSKVLRPKAEMQALSSPLI